MLTSFAALIFFLGMFIQSQFLIRGSLDLSTRRRAVPIWETEWRKIILIGGICFVMFIITWITHSFTNGLFAVGYTFAVSFPLAFRKNVFLKITEQKLLQFNILTIYLAIALFFSYFPQELRSVLWQNYSWFIIFLIILFLAIFAFPTTGTFLLIFTDLHLSRRRKLFFYIWFMTMSLLLIIYQIIAVGAFNFNLRPEPLSTFDILTLGAVLLILTSALSTIKDIFDKKKEVTHFTLNNYEDTQLSRQTAVITALIYFVLILLNSSLKLLPVYTLINLLILVTYFYTYFKGYE